MFGFLRTPRWCLAEYARQAVISKQAGINQICSLLGISKDSYYQSQGPHCSLKTKYQHLRPKIEAIIKDNPAYGYPRIKTALQKQYGETVNHKLLLKLLKLWGLALKRKLPKRKKSWIAKVLQFLQSRANLVRQLEAKGKLTDCFKVIVSDITEIKFKAGKAYLAVHLDYVGKLVYGCSLSLNPNSQLVISSFNQAVKALRKKFKIGLKTLKEIVFHQDRGSQYTSAGYTTTVLGKGAYLSFSKKGEPGDNAVNESFFSRLKDEWRDIFYEAGSFEELEKLIKKAIVYYNERRYHTSIENQTPLEFTKKQAKKLSR